MVQIVKKDLIQVEISEKIKKKYPESLINGKKYFICQKKNPVNKISPKHGTLVIEKNGSFYAIQKNKREIEIKPYISNAWINRISYPKNEFDRLWGKKFEYEEINKEITNKVLLYEEKYEDKSNKHYSWSLDNKEKAIMEKLNKGKKEIREILRNGLKKGDENYKIVTKDIGDEYFLNNHSDFNQLYKKNWVGSF